MRKHHPGYPDTEKLREISYIGDEAIGHLEGFLMLMPYFQCYFITQTLFQ